MWCINTLVFFLQLCFFLEEIYPPEFCLVLVVVVCTQCLMWVIRPDLLVVLMAVGDFCSLWLPCLSESERMTIAFIHFSVWGSDGLKEESTGAVPICLMSYTRIHSPPTGCVSFWVDSPIFRGGPRTSTSNREGQPMFISSFTPVSSIVLSIPTQPEQVVSLCLFGCC